MNPSGGMRGLSMPMEIGGVDGAKIHNVGMSGRASLTYRLHQTLESSLVLHGLLESPSGTPIIFRVVLSITYGRRAASLDDELVKQNYRSILEFQRANTPGKYLVEAWPFFSGFLALSNGFVTTLIAYALKIPNLYNAFARGETEDGCGHRQRVHLFTQPRHAADLGFSEVELAYAVSAPFGAGIDTTVGSVEVFLSGRSGRTTIPRATRKAQEELDRVVGRDRLPTFDDDDTLPYLGAFVKEVTRWRPIAPFVARAVTRDDTYEGYFIPKDTSCDDEGPEMFPEPEVFRPERFLNTTGPRFADFTLPFGFGRRSIYILVARVLWAFDVEPVRDEQGRAVLPDPDAFRFMGLSRVPEPFRFTLRPRARDVVRIIEAETAEAEERLKEWD
ncbi:O-methylsterigmatocystin oxidoreductase [Grifola frondosa]|uniref:O-methylsterigmatocystin oxidoreductase n=1 Tax=Grifola frondosa TaxID=5627 RepID=A0A1C7MN30_GRIFR|nr:O-methylsterigmatocystin oxidoreductase [Grifola frondosa]